MNYYDRLYFILPITTEELAALTTNPWKCFAPTRFFSISVFSYLSTSLHFYFSHQLSLFLTSTSSTVEHAPAPLSIMTRSLLPTAIPNPILSQLEKAKKSATLRHRFNLNSIKQQEFTDSRVHIGL